MTLFLYKLMLNLEERSVRRDLANPYDMHRTMARAYADQGQDSVRPHLWRLESSAGGDIPSVLVQSADEGCWSALPNGYLLSLQERAWNPEQVLTSGRQVAFRVRANPTVNRVPDSAATDGFIEQSARDRRKRIGLKREAEQLEWMHRQAERLGLGAVEASISQSERLRFRKRDISVTLISAQFDGRAVISNPSALLAGLRSGIGRGKSFGHGLVSLAPVRE
jgi:CRISPR system Cascade subunit CasE